MFDPSLLKSDFFLLTEIGVVPRVDIAGGRCLYYTQCLLEIVLFISTQEQFLLSYLCVQVTSKEDLKCLYFHFTKFFFLNSIFLFISPFLFIPLHFVYLSPLFKSSGLFRLWILSVSLSVCWWTKRNLIGSLHVLKRLDVWRRLPLHPLFLDVLSNFQTKFFNKSWN